MFRFIFITFILTVCFFWCSVPAALGQEVWLVHDDGTPAGSLQNLDTGDIEVVRFFALHPATLLSIRMHFAETLQPAQVFIWADNGGNAPDVNRVLWQGTVIPENGGWTEVDLADQLIELPPMQNFHVGHVLDGPDTRLFWDATGSAVNHSLVRIGGEWYFVGDETGTHSVNALVRAQVRWHDIPENYWFTDITELSGVTMGSRMAWGDFDNDGFEDLLINGQVLWHNNGDGTFTRLEPPYGVSSNGANGGIWADFDNDGCLDFYATVHRYFPPCEQPSDCIDGHDCVENRCTPTGMEELPHNRLYRGHCDGTFTDVSEEAGRPYDYLPTEGAAWGDIDGDGFVDLYVANYETPTQWTAGVLAQGNPDYLWRNNGDGTFTDISERSGIRFMDRPLCGRGVAMADFDEDGLLDIYVANYRLQGNYFFHNRGDARFRNISTENGTVGELISGAYGHSIGAAWGDVTGNGWFDLFVGNLAHPRFIEFSDKSMLYLNQGPPDYGFSEERENRGITFSETHSDPAFGDFDNDGHLDLYITAVYAGYQGFLYRNIEGSRFDDVTHVSGIRIDNGWGVTFADIDNDGDLDFLANRMYRNDHPDPGNWLKIRLTGVTANRAAIGAVVRVFSGERVWVRQVEGGKGTTTQNPLTLHFGLGELEHIDRVVIRWPVFPVEEQELLDIPVNQTLSVIQGISPKEEPEKPENPAMKGGGCSCRTGSREGSLPNPVWMFTVFFLAWGILRRILKRL